jgi:transposase
MIPVPNNVRVWLAVGRTDMRRGMNGLALQVQDALKRDLHAGDLLKIIWHDGLGMWLYAKRLERGRFIWPSPADGVVAISAAQLAYMLVRPGSGAATTPCSCSASRPACVCPSWLASTGMPSAWRKGPTSVAWARDARTDVRH